MTTTNTIAHLLSIPEERHAEFTERIAKLGKRTARTGLPPLELKLLGTLEKPVKPGSKLTRLVYRYAVETVGTIALNGWTLLGVIDYLPDGTPLVREVPGQTVPDSYRTGERSCDHCGFDRYRKETFVVGHADGSTKRVGRNCLSDFLGVDPKVMLAALEWLRDLKAGGEDEGFGWGGSRMPETFSPKFLLSIAARTIEVNGYRSRAAARAYAEKAGEEGGRVSATADDVSTYIAALNGRLFRGTVGRGWSARYIDENKEVLAHFGEVTEADAELAAKVLDFAKGLSGNSTYAYNVRALANAEQVRLSKDVGMLASAFGVYRREVEKRAAAAPTPPTAPSTYLRTIGAKLAVPEAAVVMARTFEGQYGFTTLVVFKTPEGNVLKWFASGSKESDYAPGTKLSLKGTVKKHEDYRNEKSTVLTRVSTINL